MKEQANVSGIDVTKLNYLFIGPRQCYRNYLIAVSRSFAYFIIDSDSEYYCSDVWKGIQENGTDIHYHSSFICDRRNSYFIRYELGSWRTIVIISVAGYLATIITKYIFNRIKRTGMKVRLEKTSNN